VNGCGGLSSTTRANAGGDAAAPTLRDITRRTAYSVDAAGFASIIAKIDGEMYQCIKAVYAARFAPSTGGIRTGASLAFNDQGGRSRAEPSPVFPSKT
jgi:hypothetical protein